MNSARSAVMGAGCVYKLGVAGNNEADRPLGGILVRGGNVNSGQGRELKWRFSYFFLI